MVKIVILSTAFLLLGAALPAFAQGKQIKPEASKANFKFLDEISVQPETEDPAYVSKPVPIPSVKKDLLVAAGTLIGNVETAQALQFKYSLLLDVEVELIKNINLFRLIDDWYGTRYLYGGSSKSGIDCSAFMQVLFASIYGISLPRTAKMQYDFSRRISRTELKEGDLLFFNTRGGVSHVGMYLTNNKFIHASVKGVTVSDMFDPYYASRLIGVGRTSDDVQQAAAFSTRP
jgi:lipoprotein Spr